MPLSEVESDSVGAVGAVRTFTMPSETLLRFLLLTTGLVFASLFLVESLYYTVHAARERELMTRCREVAAEDAGDASAREAQCRSSAQRDRVLWTSAVLPLTMAAGIGVSLALPRIRRRRRALQPTPESLSVVHEGVHALCSRLEVHRRPRLWWQPRRIGGAATAFGLPTRPELEISPGTASLAITDRPRFDAIIAHELAHHRNRDVLIGAVAVSSLAAFVATAVAPFMVGSLLSDVPIRVVAVSWVRVGLVVLVTAVVQRAVLRAREYDADLRATAALVDMAPALARMKSAKQASKLRDLVRELFATHPSPARRAAMVLYPMRSLVPSMVQCFAAGFFGFLSIPTISRLASAWLSGTPDVNEGMLWVAAVFSALVGAWMAVSLRRSAALDSSRSLTTIAPGFAAGLGAVAALMVFDAPLYQQMQVLPGGLTELLAMVSLIAVFTALAGWLRALGRLAEDTGLRSVSRFFVPAAGAVAAAVVIAPLVRTLFFARIAIQDDAPGGDNVIAFLQVLRLNIGTPTVMTLMVAALALPPLFLEVLVARRRPKRDTDRRARRLLAAVPVGIVAGLIGYLVSRLYEERLIRIATSEVRQHFAVGSRGVLAGELLVASGVLLAALTVVLLNPRSRGSSATLVSAAIAAMAGAGLTVADRSSHGPDLTWSQSIEAAAPIVAFGMMAALTVTALQWTRFVRIPASAKIPLLAVAVVATFLSSIPLAAWVAAPQGMLSEIPTFAAWQAADGVNVAPLLDECSENGARVRVSATQAAEWTPLADENLRALDRARFRTNTFRSVIESLSDATRWCASGLRLVAASGPGAAAEFTASLCRYGDALAVLGALEGIAQVPAVAQQDFCRSATNRPVPSRSP